MVKSQNINKFIAQVNLKIDFMYYYGIMV